VCAIRLKLLTLEPRAYRIFDNREWDRAYDQASRAFHRNYNLLTRVQRRYHRPTPLPFAFPRASSTSAPAVAEPARQAVQPAPTTPPEPDRPPAQVVNESPQVDATADTPFPWLSPEENERVIERANRKIEEFERQRKAKRRPDPAEALRKRVRARLDLPSPFHNIETLPITITSAPTGKARQATRASPA
jgi:hypothetical protein